MTGTAVGTTVYRAPMVTLALRPIGHFTAWIVWHTAKVSLLDDLDAPRPPGD